MRNLVYLDFDVCEDTDGLQTWSALASPAAVHSALLQAEVQALIEDLKAHLGEPGPIDDGHAWDMALESETEDARLTISLHLSGSQALRERLSLWQAG